MTGDNNKPTAEKVSELFKSYPVGTVVKINGRTFTVQANTAKNVQNVFEEEYPDEEMSGLEFFTEEVDEQENN